MVTAIAVKGNRRKRDMFCPATANRGSANHLIYLWFVGSPWRAASHGIELLSEVLSPDDLVAEVAKMKEPSMAGWWHVIKYKGFHGAF